MYGVYMCFSLSVGLAGWHLWSFNTERPWAAATCMYDSHHM